MQTTHTPLERILQIAGKLSFSHLAAACILSPLALNAAPETTPTPTTSGTTATGPVYKLVNKTGKFSDQECYWTLDGKTWTPFAEQSSVPCPVKNGRIYFALGSTAPKSIGDRSSHWDFVEYAANAVGPGKPLPTWHGNTTQVDGFCIPLTIQMGEKLMGNTGPRTALFEKFRKEAPEIFKPCVVEDKRIVSPCSTPGFRKGGAQENYFQAYVNEVWAMYAEEKKTPSGKWIGKVEGDALTFKPVDGVGKVYTCKSKPNTQDIFMGTGVLGNNPRFCGAFNRHVAADPADWDKPQTYYKAEPCNWYSKFFHENSIDNKAYGFCYDDDGGQAAFFSATGPELTVTLYWDTPPAKK